MQTTSTSQGLLTYEDYCQIPEDGNRYEVIDGLLFMAPAPFVRHQRVSLQISFRLVEYVKLSGSGEVFYAPCDVVLSENNIVQPDVLYISENRTSIITDKNVQGPPDLLIEILSQSNRQHDEIVKRELYERFGVLEYWIVDPDAETVKVYRLQDGSYGEPSILSRKNNDELESPLLPGFCCTLDELFVN